MVSGSWVLQHSRPAPYDFVVIVIREALEHDCASDGLTLTSRVCIVCQGSARWVSTCARWCVTAQGRPNVSSILLEEPKAVCVLH